MNAPTSSLVNFFKTAGQPAGICSFDEVERNAKDYLCRAGALLDDVRGGQMDVAARIRVTDEVAALCTGAVAAAHGLMLSADIATLKTEDALTALVDELELALDTHKPLASLRYLAANPQRINEGHAFLAHQGAFIGTALLEWTAEHVQQVLAH